MYVSILISNDASLDGMHAHTEGHHLRHTTFTATTVTTATITTTSSHHLASRAPRLRGKPHWRSSFRVLGDAAIVIVDNVVISIFHLVTAFVIVIIIRLVTCTLGGLTR